MSAPSIRPMPAFSDVLRRQVRLLWTSRAALFPVLMMPLALLATAGAFARALPEAMSAEMFELVVLTPLVIFVGGAWGILVWRDEPPSKRGYHRSLPVDVAHHDMARVAAGAVWLAPALLLFFAAGIVVTVLRGDGAALMAAGPLLWLGHVAAALIMYALLAALSTAVEKPLSWIVWGYVALVALVFLADALGILDTFVEAGLGRLTAAPYGVGWAVGGGVAIARDRLAGDAAAVTSWLPTAAAWLILGSLLVFAAARWRRMRGV